MPDKRDIFQNTAVQVLLRVLTLGFALVSTKLITNYLGTAGTGEYNTISTYLGFWIVIADLGLFSSAVREMSKSPEREREILGNVFTVRLISAVVATIIACGLVFLTDYSQSFKLGVVASAGFVFFNLVGSVWDMILQTKYRMQYSAIAEAIAKLATLGALFLVVTTNAGFVALAATFTLTGFLMFAFKWLFGARYQTVSPIADKERALWILGISAPLGLVFILNNIFFKVDGLMLFALKGAEAAGLYSVAYKVLEVTIFVGSYFASSLKPVLARQVTEDPERVGHTVNKAFLVMLITATPITVLAAVFSREIILFLSNASFLPGTGALILLSLSLPLIYLDILLGELLIALDARKLLLRIAVIMLIFNAGLNLALIPHFSYLGAAFVTVLSEFILLLINLHYTRKLIPYSLDLTALGKIAAIALIILAVGLAARQLPVNFLVLMAACTAIYAWLVLAFRLTSLKELRSLL